jgi:hypothetical protein
LPAAYRFAADRAVYPTIRLTFRDLAITGYQVTPFREAPVSSGCARSHINTTAFFTCTLVHRARGLWPWRLGHPTTCSQPSVLQTVSMFSVCSCETSLAKVSRLRLGFCSTKCRAGRACSWFRPRTFPLVYLAVNVLGIAKFSKQRSPANPGRRNRASICYLGAGIQFPGRECARPRLPVNERGMAFRVPSHNDHPLPIRPKEEARREPGLE